MFVPIAVQCILLENPDSSIKEIIKPYFHSHFDLTEAIAGGAGGRGGNKRDKEKGGQDTHDTKRKRKGQSCPSHSFPISTSLKTQYCP